MAVHGRRARLDCQLFGEARYRHGRPEMVDAADQLDPAVRHAWMRCALSPAGPSAFRRRRLEAGPSQRGAS
eukprot:scaffold4059_cov393-Prasinococcus_capsulatus_cf.AAC.5